MHTVAEIPTFVRQAEKLFSEDERRELMNILAANPLAGDVIPARVESGNYASQHRVKASAAVRG